MAKTKETIAKHDLVSKGESILVALSGGPDSVALLHLMHRLAGPMRLRLCAVYVNHRIRPRASKKEETFCQKLCERLGIEFTSVTRDVPDAVANGRGIEETARRLRYDALESIADEFGCKRIALAHHAGDNVETVLFRMIRGTGSAGLAGIPVRRGRIIRPLLFARREEIIEYLNSEKLDYCHDRSNLDKRFSRNFIRHELLPLIRRRLNPAVDKAILGLSETAAEEEAFLDTKTRAKARTIVSVTPGGKIELVLTPFLRYDKWLRRRILRLCYRRVSQFGLAPDREIVERLDLLAGGTGKSLSLPAGVRVVRLENQLVFFRYRKRSFSKDVVLGKRLRLDWPQLTFLARETSPDEQVFHKRRSRKVVMDAEKLAGPLEIRSIRPGDRFRPLGSPGEKKIGDYLTDKKLPALYRDELPVVCDRKGIVWLCGYEIDERVKITPNTRKTITIEQRIRKGRAATAV